MIVPETKRIHFLEKIVRTKKKSERNSEVSQLFPTRHYSGQRAHSSPLGTIEMLFLLSSYFCRYARSEISPKLDTWPRMFVQRDTRDDELTRYRWNIRWLTLDQLRDFVGPRRCREARGSLRCQVLLRDVPSSPAPRPLDLPHVIAKRTRSIIADSDTKG